MTLYIYYICVELYHFEEDDDLIFNLDRVTKIILYLDKKIILQQIISNPIYD